MYENRESLIRFIAAIPTTHAQTNQRMECFVSEYMVHEYTRPRKDVSFAAQLLLTSLDTAANLFANTAESSMADRLRAGRSGLQMSS